ncbi:unnamed protein product [Rhodiola kirilowii]
MKAERLADEREGIAPWKEGSTSRKSDRVADGYGRQDVQDTIGAQCDSIGTHWIVAIRDWREISGFR